MAAKLRAAVVLAGGLSKRMGANKALLRLGGETMVTRIVGRIQPIVDEVIVALDSQEDSKPFKDVLPSSVKVVQDLMEGQTPLIGIYTGFSQMGSECACVLSCDVPFVNPRVLARLFGEVYGFDAVVPRWSDCSIEPLQAVYLVEPSLTAVKQALDAGGVKITELIDRLPRVKHIPVDELRSLDPDLLTFFNVNTPKDYEDAKLTILRQGRG